VRFTIIGAHNLESNGSKLPCILIDEKIALDAGSLASGLSFFQQQSIKAIFLSHAHYDHVRDIPCLGLYRLHHLKEVEPLLVFGTSRTLEILSQNLINGIIYPRFTERPSPEKPTMKLIPLEILNSFSFENLTFLPIPVNHGEEAVGFGIFYEDKAVFYTGDTGPGLEHCWEHITPQFLIVDVTLPDSLVSVALEGKHLTPSLLKKELEEFKDIKGFFPSVICVHVNPHYEADIRREIKAVEEELKTSIKVGFEGYSILL